MGTAGCGFCDVIEGRVEVVVVARTEHTLAFLDRSPVFYGHTLVIPLDHHETLSDLPPELLEPFFAEVQRLSGAVERGLGAAGSFVAMNNRVSQSVPHLHAHVVPRNRKDGLRGFFWPRLRYRDEAHMAEVAGALREVLSTS
ncbi:MAG: HIT family protein [Acidimicrobiales bacterium]